MADQKEFKRRLKVLMNKPENLTCVDCNERQPRWASLIKPPPGSPDPMGMGALMCLECSGSHRRLGVHISFVRSVNLDSCTFLVLLLLKSSTKYNLYLDLTLHHVLSRK
jgi:Putative GTPase activating protein for Arf